LVVFFSSLREQSAREQSAREQSVRICCTPKPRPNSQSCDMENQTCKKVAEKYRQHVLQFIRLKI